jgi:hypothetical protein
MVIQQKQKGLIFRIFHKIIIFQISLDFDPGIR